MLFHSIHLVIWNCFQDPSSTDQDEECSKRSQSPILIAEGKKERSESEENNSDSGSETELPGK
jgi:hypothetical protein